MYLSGIIIAHDLERKSPLARANLLASSGVYQDTRITTGPLSEEELLRLFTLAIAPKILLVDML